MEILKSLFSKYKSYILYLFFGGCATLINIVAYAVCAHLFECGTVVSNVVAWIVAVIFAYISNRTMVFESTAKNVKEIVKEAISFFSCRLLTGFLDLVIMYIFVDLIGVNDLVMKVISNIIVIILNYVASKLVVFKKK